MKSRIFAASVLIGAASAAFVLASPATARACGGFFCSSPNLPVNQAAERIIFSANEDGTVTAVIQILYQGPAPAFSWLLPISSVPKAGDIGVASNLAFQRLQNATNPQYNLTVRVEGVCEGGGRSTGGTGGSAQNASGAGGGSPGGSASPPGVTVESSGTVGAFDYSVISVNQSVGDPSALAVEWLTTNGYSVGDGAPGLIRPYLLDGLHLLALRLVKGADAGSIRPIVLTYDGKNPMIPIKLTAVAANPDMGVMTWLLSRSRGVPQNYLSLELNEARINWFNASSNYNDVVTAAADDAGGQGFVTEFARPTTALTGVVWTPSDEALWQRTQSTVYPNFSTMFNSLFLQWGQWDGFWDAVRMAVTLPSGVAFADFQLCPSCYADRIQFAPSVLMSALATNVIKPVKDVQELLDRNGYVTRLYSTMSAKDMTLDPLFTFNTSLGDVSNIHSAERVIECAPEFDTFNAPWRIELPQGGVVRGTGNPTGTWPTALDAQPSTNRIVRVSASGPGVVVEDNAATIQLALQSYNASFPGGSGAGAGGNNSDGGAVSPVALPSGGCSTSSSPARGAAWLLAALALGWAKLRRAA